MATPGPDNRSTSARSVVIRSAERRSGCLALQRRSDRPAAGSGSLFDGRYNAVIVDVEPSTAVRQAEVTSARTMIERTRENHDLCPKRVAADTAYGSAEMLEWLVHEQGIEPHIPVIGKSAREDGTFSRRGFAYDQAADRYSCPGGKQLRRHRRAFRRDHPEVPPDDTYRYRASKIDCDACALKPRCCPNTPARKGDPLDLRRRQGLRPRHRHDRRLRHLPAQAEKGRDAVRPPQTNPQARPTTTTWALRRPR
jgi:hypothetical protein